VTNLRDILPDFLFGFNAYLPQDVKYLISLAARGMDPNPNPDLIIDYLGMRIDPDYEPLQQARRGEVISKPPFPTDTILSEGIEYAALAQSLMSAGNDFDVIELGAGWGPWVTRAAISARRLAKSRIVISAVEADHARFDALRRHLALNELVPLSAPNAGAAGELVWYLNKAIVWNDDKGAFWPEGGLGDAGRKAISPERNMPKDSALIQKASRRQDSISLSNVIQNHKKVDLLHMDVQGTEMALISSALRDLNERVHHLFVGTHSRLIEGEILTLLLQEGWNLLREEPCLFRPRTGGVPLEELTIRDGGQLWVNPRLVRK